MHKIFIDENINSEFFRNGFVKLPLFNNQQVQEIADFYLSIASEQKINDVAFHTTSNSSKKELIKKVTAFLKPYFITELNKYMVDYELAIGNFIVKEPGKGSEVKAHMDSNLVDENKDISFSAWVCLEDANYKTGNMQFIPGSHTFYPSRRVIPDRHQYYEKIQPYLPRYLIDVPTKAGEVLIFLHSVIHASRINRSSAPRVACIMGGRNKDAEQIFYYLGKNTSSDKIEKYKVSVDSYLNLEKDKKPPFSEFLGYERFDFVTISLSDFHKKAIQYSSFWQRSKSKIINRFIGSSYQE